jgi:hypothetical protein
MSCNLVFLVRWVRMAEFVVLTENEHWEAFSYVAISAATS